MTLRSLVLMVLLAVTLGSAHAAPMANTTTAANTSLDDKAMEAVYRKNQLALEDWLEHSNSPRDWALASQLLEYPYASSAVTRPRGAALLRKAAEAAPNDRLIQWLWIEETAEDSGCPVPASCPNRAHALAMLDPDNAAAWLSVIEDAWRRKDTLALENAIQHMANASRYDDSFGVSFRAWEHAVARYSWFTHFKPARGSAKLEPAEGSVELKPSEESIEIEWLGLHTKLWEWKSPRSMNDIDHSSEGAAIDLVMQGPIRNTPQVVRACDPQENPEAGRSRYEYCQAIGRMMLNQSSFLILRIGGALILRASDTATSDDIGHARTLRWQWERFEALTAQLAKDATLLGQYLDDYDATNSEVLAMQRTLQHAHIPLNPPPTWQLMHDGKAINSLGDWHPSKESR